MREYANILAPHSIRVNSVHPTGVDTPMINNDFIREWLQRMGTQASSNALPVPAIEARGRRERGGLLGIRRRPLCHRCDAARRCGRSKQALMARNPAAQTAFGPMVEAAIEQYEPPERRLVDDDLAAAILPAGQRAVVRAMRWPLLRRLTISAGEKAMRGSWAIICCRKALHRRQTRRGTRGHRRRRHTRCGHGHQGFTARTPIRPARLRGRPSGQRRAQESRRAARARGDSRLGSPGAVGLRARRPVRHVVPSTATAPTPAHSSYGKA